jgi:hypothetical protein
MKRWHLPTLEPSSDKRTAREPGTAAPRVPSVGAQEPRVLFSSPDCRLVAGPEQQAALLLAHLPAIEHGLTQGAVVVIEPARVRIRQLAIGG